MKGCSIVRLCELSGISTQAYYKGRKSRKRKAIDESLVVEEVKIKRRRHPRMGTRKLLHELHSVWAAVGLKIGRDRLFDVLRHKNLLIEPKRKWIQTTDSRHNLPLYRNLLTERKPTAPNQVFVSDITYLRTDEGWLYLSLITDLYSRKIVGWNLADNLNALESVKALKMAMKQVPNNRWPIHHSDRGSQYCCYEYTQILRENDWSISMTEVNHCAENSNAERVNGILKNEYNLDLEFRNKSQALRAVEEAVYLYNEERPHNSLGKRKPSDVHRNAA
jgi:transposase InsO family protein